MRRMLIVCAAAALFAAVPAFGAGDKEKGNTAGAAPAGKTSEQVVFRMGEYVLDTQMANRNPFVRSGTWPWLFENDLVYDSILHFNWLTGSLEPAVAVSHEWSSDQKSITLKIRPKIQWHDGKPLTAEDVAFTIGCLQKNPPIDGYGIGKQISGITAAADKVVIILKTSNPSFPNYLSTIKVVPKHIWENQNPVTYTNPEIIGSGPFKFVRYNTGTDIQFEANKAYWLGAPQVDKFIVQMYSSAPNLTLALLKGDIQATSGAIVMPSIPEFMTKPGAKMQLFAGLANFAVLINNEKPLLSDPAVRKALVRAVNQKELISKGEYNGVFPTSAGWLPELFGQDVNAKVKDIHSFDPSAAKKILEEAGYTLGADKIYEKDGKRLSFTYYNASGAPAQQMEAGMIQQWLLNLGIEIIPKIATWPELVKIEQEGKYDLIQARMPFPPDPFAALNSTFNSAMTAPIGTITPGMNYMRYRNPQVDDLLLKISLSTDPERRKALFHTVQEIIASDAPFIPMYNTGGHIPHYDGSFTGWAATEDSIWSAKGIIGIRRK